MSFPLTSKQQYLASSDSIRGPKNFQQFSHKMAYSRGEGNYLRLRSTCVSCSLEISHFPCLPVTSRSEAPHSRNHRISVMILKLQGCDICVTYWGHNDDNLDRVSTTASKKGLNLLQVCVPGHARCFRYAWDIFKVSIWKQTKDFFDFKLCKQG